MTERRVYVVPPGTAITPEVVAAANSNGCREIARGVPPALAHLAPQELPAVVVEEIPDAADAPPDVSDRVLELEGELAEMKARLAALEG